MITIKNFDEVKNGVFEVLTASFGAVDSEPDSNLSQLTEPFTLNSVDLYQQLDNTIQSLSPNSATGEDQNRCYAFNGLVRHDPTATTAPLILDGDEGVIVTAGSLVTSAVNNAEYSVDTDTTIAKGNSLQVKFEVGAIGVGDTVSVLINAVTISVVSASTDPIGTALLLTDAINTDQSVATASSDGAIITCNSVDLRTPFSADAGTNTTITALGTPTNATGTTAGKISCPAKSVTIITTAITGWNGVDNLLAGQRGRNAETDEDFRERRMRSFLMAGGASVLGLQTRLLNNVSGVSFCRVYENATSENPDKFGRPAHSIQVVAEGGTPADIANEIALNKSGGVATHGDITVSLTDSEGNNYPINFDRPVVKYAWVKITIDSKNFEETFPPDGIDIIRQAVYDYGSTSFGYGDDLIIQKFYTPVYSVAGIKIATVQLGVSDDPNTAPTFSAENISIAPTEYTDWLNTSARLIITDNS